MRLSRLVTVVLALVFLPQICRADKSPPDEDIAGNFAPIFYQALGEKPRNDFITNFDFDNDWRGDNNWDNAADSSLLLRAFIYYSLVETSTHYFIHYAVFHPRDYKGGETRGPALGELIREGVKAGGQYDPTGMADEAALAHENDMEGCLVVVEKDRRKAGTGRTVYVETLHHNAFSRYIVADAANGASSAKVEGQHVLLYIEPKGHGIEALTGEPKQVSNKIFLKYVFKDNAARSDHMPTCKNPGIEPCNNDVGYALIPIEEELWPKAHGGITQTYGDTHDYGTISIRLKLNGAAEQVQEFKIGTIGYAFAGFVGGANLARPPWGWVDRNNPSVPLGTWFFDPATTIKRDFNLSESFSTAYIRVPFWANGANKPK